METAVIYYSELKICAAGLDQAKKLVQEISQKSGCQIKSVSCAYQGQNPYHNAVCISGQTAKFKKFIEAIKNYPDLPQPPFPTLKQEKSVFKKKWE